MAMNLLGTEVEYSDLNDLCALQSRVFKYLLPIFYHCFENLVEVGE